MSNTQKTSDAITRIGTEFKAIRAEIATAKQEAKDELIDGAPGMSDTLAELATQIAGNQGSAASILATQAAIQTAQAGILTGLGTDYDTHDFVADFEAALV